MGKDLKQTLWEAANIYALASHAEEVSNIPHVNPQFQLELDTPISDLEEGVPVPKTIVGFEIPREFLKNPDSLDRLYKDIEELLLFNSLTFKNIKSFFISSISGTLIGDEESLKEKIKQFILDFNIVDITVDKLWNTVRSNPGVVIRKYPEILEHLIITSLTLIGVEKENGKVFIRIYDAPISKEQKVSSEGNLRTSNSFSISPLSLQQSQELKDMSQVETGMGMNKLLVRIASQL